MNRIRLLSDQVANQIAAGEVVERPASVVKELVENSLDANATRIMVEIQSGGRSLIKVVDDGLGMSRDDALLCLERHATSKIRKAEDLAAIATMGFRGEALPSIASVSRFTLTTRERDSESPEGTQVIMAGGKMLEVKAAGCATGTIVDVRQLFYNLPARRKFLRSEETEAAHIQHYLTLAALAYPEVAFTFLKDGRVVWQWPAVSMGAGRDQLTALSERLRMVYGSEQKVLRVDFSSDLSEGPEPGSAPEDGTVGPPEQSLFRLWGFIGSPGVSRATREDQHLFVNRRPVENRGLNYALLEGYHTALMKGRYPVACLFVEIDPAAVDVNIHPAKKEVKFRREMEVRRLVAHGVRQALLEFHAGGAKPASQAPQPQRPGATDTVPIAVPAEKNSAPPLPGFPPVLRPSTETAPSRPVQPMFGMGFSQPARAAQVPPPRAPQGTSVSGAAAAPATPAVTASTMPAPVPLLDVPLRMLGVIGKLYLVLESDRGMVLLDQHAAHERILYEQMLARLEGTNQPASQRLLLPETVELSARDAAFLRQQLPALTRLGVGLSEFGDRTFLLDALPPLVKPTEARRFVLQLVDELKAAGQEVNSMRLGEQTIAKTVCRHAVKAHDPLAGAELEQMIRDLRHCVMPYTCPHGRPTLIEMNFRELEKKFGRVQ